MGNAKMFRLNYEKDVIGFGFDWYFWVRGRYLLINIRIPFFTFRFDSSGEFDFGFNK